MTKIVSLINMKGGVGKSTLTVNLAWYFAENWQRRVLVVDLDPQFNTSQYLLGKERYEREIIAGHKPTVWEIFEQYIQTPLGEVKIANPRESLSRIYTGQNSSKLELLASKLELSFTLKNPARRERRLKDFLALIESDYDLILIDCAPTDSVLTTAAYMASQQILVPVKLDFLSSIGIPLIVRSMQEFERDYGAHNLQLAGIVFNAVNNDTADEIATKSLVRQDAARNSWYIFKNEVPFSRSFPRSAREHQPVYRTSFARSDKMQLFEKFAQEFARRIEL